MGDSKTVLHKFEAKVPPLTLLQKCKWHYISTFPMTTLDL